MMGAPLSVIDNNEKKKESNWRGCACILCGMQKIVLPSPLLVETVGLSKSKLWRIIINEA